MDSPPPPDPTHVLNAIHERRSTSRLGGDVGDEAIRTLVAAAVAAPNHKLTQPWRFTVLRGAARERLGARWGAVVAAECGLDAAAAAEFGARETKKPLRAPVVIAVSTSTSPDPVIADEDFAATAAATQNLLLAAHALGIGSIWRTGAMVRHAEIKAHLGLDPADRIVGFVYLGEAVGDPPATPARDVESKIGWRA